MTNVAKFYPANAAEDPDNVLEQSIGQFESVVVIGWSAGDQTLDARASTNIDHAHVLWLTEKFKAQLLAGEYGETP